MQGMGSVRSSACKKQAARLCHYVFVLQCQIQAQGQIQPGTPQQVSTQDIAGPMLARVDPSRANQRQHQRGKTQERFLLPLQVLESEDEQPPPERHRGDHMPAREAFAFGLLLHANHQWVRAWTIDDEPEHDPDKGTRPAHPCEH
jgi:hypothetical protein